MNTDVLSDDNNVNETSDISESNNNYADDTTSDKTHSDDREEGEHADTNDSNNNSANISNESTDSNNDEQEIIVNTLLAYACYSISCATADNTRALMSSHFTIDEICDAKELLWTRCNLGETINRKNTKIRTAKEAHIGDILDNLYTLDIAKNIHYL